MTIGDAEADSIVTPLDLVETNSYSNTQVQIIVAAMLYLDSDGNPSNGIQVDVNKASNLPSNLENASESDLPPEAQSKLTEAATHIANTINNIMSDYIAGTYKGSYSTTSGNCGSGSVTLYVGPTGNVSGEATVSAGNGGGTISITGTMDYKGFSTGTAGSAVWSGQWSAYTISGTWQDSSYGCQGTFSVTKQ